MVANWRKTYEKHFPNRNIIIFIQENAFEIVVCQNGGHLVQGGDELIYFSGRLRITTPRQYTMRVVWIMKYDYVCIFLLSYVQAYNYQVSDTNAK